MGRATGLGGKQKGGSAAPPQGTGPACVRRQSLPHKDARGRSVGRTEQTTAVVLQYPYS